MSKALKVIVGVVASIAIPFVAPYVAQSIGLSAAVSGALGATATSAAISSGLAGAALGAANAALTGGNVGKGALFGGLGGGLKGYTGFKALAGTAPVAAPGLTSAQLGIDTINQQAAAAGLSSGAAPGLTSAQLGIDTINQQAAAAGLSSGAAATGGQTFLSGIKEGLVKTFSPENVLQAGLQLGSSALAGSGMTGAERRAFAAQEEEARRVADMTRAADQTRFNEATRMLNEARYFDPEYMGLQSARREQQRGGIAKAEALRGMSGSERVAEARRRDLGISRNVGTAYDVGYGAGVEGSLKARSAGLANLPSATGAAGQTAYQNLSAMYDAGETRRRQRAADIGRMFGSFTGKEQSERKG